MAEKNPMGTTGQTVAQNVKRLRESQQLTYARLARKTSDLGYPIAVLALSHIERGMRRVDVDDLAVLARAFGVSPALMLVPPGSDTDWRPGYGSKARRLWRWLVALGPVDEADRAEVSEWRILPDWDLLKTASERKLTTVELHRLADAMGGRE